MDRRNLLIIVGIVAAAAIAYYLYKRESKYNPTYHQTGLYLESDLSSTWGGISHIKNKYTDANYHQHISGIEKRLATHHHRMGLNTHFKDLDAKLREYSLSDLLAYAEETVQKVISTTNYYDNKFKHSQYHPYLLKLWKYIKGRFAKTECYQEYSTIQRNLQIYLQQHASDPSYAGEYKELKMNEKSFEESQCNKLMKGYWRFVQQVYKWTGLTNESSNLLSTSFV